MNGDVYEIGWWIESTEEELYGPVSQATLRGYLEDGVISPNTLVRHCTRSEARPVADQLVMAQESQPGEAGRAFGDRLEKVWPRRRKQQRELAEGTLPCVRHKNPAVLVCVRCQAPYCQRCRMKPYRRPYYFCRRCQSNLYNRRASAYIVDSVLFFVSLQTIVVLLMVAGMGEQTAQVLLNLLLVPVTVGFVLRDVVFGGAGPGKRLTGLRVVRRRDGATPLSYGQALLRWLSLAIPFFNLVDLSVPYRDPLQRRYGDRWAGTQVIDTPRKLGKVRAKAESLMVRKGIELPPVETMSVEQFAQIAR